MSVAWNAYADAESWTAAVAQALARELEAALAERAPDGERVTLAAAGGGTPGPILERLGAQALPWERVRVTPTDDRCVADDHPARNAAMLRARLAQAAAAGAEVAALEDAPDAAPDIVLLGFGGDQHVASIFPAGEGMAAARGGDAPVTLMTTPEPLPPEAPFARVTLSLPALFGARRILIAAAGPDKRRAFEAARDANPPETPLAAVLAQTETPVDVYWRA